MPGIDKFNNILISILEVGTICMGVTLISIIAIHYSIKLKAQSDTVIFDGDWGHLEVQLFNHNKTAAQNGIGI